MAGQREVERPRLWVTMADSFANQPGKQTFLRVILDRTSDGAMARLLGSRDAARQCAVAHANGLVIVPPEVSALAAGERVEALALETLN
jgi:Molybdopterin biosynthesis enzyme